MPSSPPVLRDSTSAEMDLESQRTHIAQQLPHGLIDEEVRPSWDRDVDGYDEDYREFLRDQFDLRMRG